MTDTTTPTEKTVNTVLGPLPAHQLGIVAIHEALLSVMPGAQFAPDISMDRAEIFDTLSTKLIDFRNHGGQTIVDSTGMFHGRDLHLYETLARSTGINIIASTGMGPEEMLGGYFLTPQTNPPTPWPAEKFAELFSLEATQGMVVPRLERRAPAGLVTTTAARTGMSPTEESLFRGAARTALNTGIPVSIRFGANVLADLDIILTENLPANRVLVADLDRRDAAESITEVARRGAMLGIDNIGMNENDEFLTDQERATLILELVEAGFGGQILLSSSAIGVAKGLAPHELPFSYLLSTFMPQLAALGLSDEAAQRILVENPRELLTVS